MKLKINTLEYAENLQASGFTQTQASGLAKALTHVDVYDMYSANDTQDILKEATDVLSDNLNKQIKIIHNRCDELNVKFDKRCDALDAKIDKRCDALDAKIDKRCDAIEEKFDKRCDAIEEKFDKRCDAIEEKFDKRCDAIEEKFDKRCDAIEEKFDKRCDTLDTKIDRIDEKLDSKFRWLAGIMITVSLGLASYLSALIHFIR